MARMKTPNGHSDWRAHLGRTREGGALLEVDAWIPSEVAAISPLVDRLMRLIEGSHCIRGEEHTVQLALREALNNAVVHGNRLDARKLVHVRCRCKVGEGISLIVSDQGQGFDPRTAPGSVVVENLEADHGRGIHLMKLAWTRSRSHREAPRFTCARSQLGMREQVRVIKRRSCRRFSVVEYAFTAFRYLVTGIVVLLLVLLIFALES